VIRIFKVFVPTSILALFLSEVLLISACYLAADYFVGDAANFRVYDSWLFRIGLVVGLILLGLYFAGLYEGAPLGNWLLLFQNICYVLGLSFILEALVSYWAADLVLVLDTMIVGSLLTLFSLFGWRLLFNIAIQNAVGAHRVLFLGLSPTVVQLAAHMRAHPELGLIPIGYVDKENKSNSTLARLGSVSDLTYLIDDLQPHWIVIGNRTELHSRSINEILNLRFGGIQAEDAATLYETTSGRVCASELRPSELLYSDRLQPGASKLKLQTIYSTGFALAALIITFPLMAFMAVLLKASSSGPVLLREQRVGLHGIPFTMYRFQWMSAKNGVRSATSVGMLLRRFRLDALPELYNVLRGDMSVVGPLADRPDFANRLNQLIPFYQQRHIVKPGMTGWAQFTNPKNNLVNEVIHRLECDLYYIKNLSPSLDLFVLLRSTRLWPRRD
jgi:lipopolysaccharide/colanic/teichoic acid biosynthesis glycosyltransferase